MILYLIRHGQSTANESGVIQGRKEFPLSVAGNKQGMLLGQFFASKSLDYIYTSDLERAHETAKYLSVHQPLDVIPWDKIREIGLGPLEGKTRNEITLQFPEVHETTSILTTGIAGTETVEEITKRCQYVLDQLLTGHKRHRIALVSHGGFISIFLMYLMFGEKWNDTHRPFIIGNTGVTKVEFLENGKPIFHYVNKDSHLLLGDMRSESVLY
ncbi:histidine phosphatase family protein [Anaerobacillus alkaliphilus]|uniref:Histidine phosphatase family protein n=1 Tax=Anaerobacillus alkaliphilus TaxID=1548597 RepID=A0A4Q0VUY7_9BACI|nr:histidine phosphatase family protein [Anaerobacillus alkaliphilus]RXJ00338.1 histidine phosphatase family protein [Anaerobacillus alkaliphilus]